MDLNREQWQPGDEAWFEYHCLESPQSADALAWYHSHQRVVVVREEDSDAWEGSTFSQRSEAGQPKVYAVRFTDGLEWVVFEDELLTRPEWERPDPPKERE